jgi:hypothetical protein
MLKKIERRDLAVGDIIYDQPTIEESVKFIVANIDITKNQIGLEIIGVGRNRNHVVYTKNKRLNLYLFFYYGNTHFYTEKITLVIDKGFKKFTF